MQYIVEPRFAITLMQGNLSRVGICCN